MISPFLKANGAAWVVERKEKAAMVIAAEESFMLMIDLESWLLMVEVGGSAGYSLIDIESRRLGDEYGWNYRLK